MANLAVVDGRECEGMNGRWCNHRDVLGKVVTVVLKVKQDHRQVWPKNMLNLFPPYRMQIILAAPRDSLVPRGLLCDP